MTLQRRFAKGTKATRPKANIRKPSHTEISIETLELGAGASQPASSTSADTATALHEPPPRTASTTVTPCEPNGRRRAVDPREGVGQRGVAQPGDVA